MIKRFSVFAILILLFASNTYAANNTRKEKIVTSEWSVVMGNAKVANHYLSDQEHSGHVLGLSMEFGSFYKKSQNLSWDLDVTYFLSPYSGILGGLALSNPANTSFMSLNSFQTDYGTYYNWNPAKNLYFKVGGSFDLLAGVNIGKPNHVNNIFDVDFQTQLKAAAGVRYGWNFKKFGLFLQADVAVPFVGMTLSSGPYESMMHGIFQSQILPGNTSPLFFTSFHNLKGFNLDVQLDLVFRNTTLFFAKEINNRCWDIRGIQNYRMYNLTKVGLMVDLVARRRLNSNNRYF